MFIKDKLFIHNLFILSNNNNSPNNLYNKSNNCDFSE